MAADLATFKKMEEEAQQKLADKDLELAELRELLKQYEGGEVVSRKKTRGDDDEDDVGGLSKKGTMESTGRRGSGSSVSDKVWFFFDQNHPYTSRTDLRQIRLNGYSGFLFKQIDDRFGKIVVEGNKKKTYKVGLLQKFLLSFSIDGFQLLGGSCP